MTSIMTKHGIFPTQFYIGDRVIVQKKTTGVISEVRLVLRDQEAAINYLVVDDSMRPVVAPEHLLELTE